jgi:FdhD protein
MLYKLPRVLRDGQAAFAATGGLHAAACFDLGGAVVSVREDIGRHNALDKLVGAGFLNGELPWRDRILMLSGRASFEQLQKAAATSVT